MREFEKVTTRGGDRGKSSLYDGTRLWKDDVVFEALGSIDKLASYLGLLRSELKKNAIGRQLESIQKSLLVVGAMTATPRTSDLYGTFDHIDEEDVRSLERYEEKILARTKIQDRFVLPGDTGVSAHADIARTMCREAERRVVSCIRTRAMAHLIPVQHYLNRLSDYLFILARHLEQHRPK